MSRLWGMLDIRTRIRFARESAGLSQEGLARRVDVSSRTIARLERGDYEPTIAMLRLLAAVLSVDVAWLLTGEGRGPANDSTGTPPQAA